MPDSLVNIATGVIPTINVPESMLGALDKGHHLAQKLVSERLVIDEGKGKPTKSMHDPLPRSGVKTMTDLSKPVKVRQKSIVINSQIMYLRLPNK